MELELNRSTEPFSLEYTLDCGQLFRWKKLNNWWYGVVEDKVIKIKQLNNTLKFQVFPDTKKPLEFIRRYMRLNDDLPTILSEINKDHYMNDAINRFCGMRLCKQEPWECLISYICATYKGIPAIKKMVNNISEQFGKKLIFDSYTFYTFPSPTDLAKGTQEKLKCCGLGFRTNRVLETAKIVERGNLNLESLKRMNYCEAKKKLLELPGVGHKVADCVLVFSLEKLEAFPIDVWIKRAATNIYTDYFEPLFIKKVAEKGSLTTKEYETIGSFGRKYFGRYAGYAQEYLFHYLRTKQK
jgi:N-glycosylase/DNA lyase